MKKFGKIVYFLALIIGSVVVLYWSQINETLQSMSTNQGGFLVGMANLIGQYFKNWEAWNMIFLVLFISISLLSFVLLDKGVEVLIRKFTKDKPKMNFVTSGWFVLTVQKGMAGFFTLILFLLACNAAVIIYGNSHSVRDAISITSPQPVLILGTSKMLRSGKGKNLYYTYRIDAANDLWKNGKVEYFIISGDRAGDHYDETRDISNDLLALGVPQDKIKIDTAGFRTLDSMVRIRGMFRVKDLIIISQQFHVQRALFLAMFYNIVGTGYYANGSSTLGMLTRETFGKCKLVLDIVLFNMMPKVSLNDKELMTYREDFQVKSDLHVILLLVVSIAGLSSLGLMFKAID